MRRCVVAILFVGLIAGCSLYKALPLPIDKLSRSPYRKANQSITVFVQPLDILEDTHEYFHADLMSDGILPFYLLFLNSGSNPIRLVRDEILLTFKGEVELKPILPSLVAYQTSSSKIGALKLGTMGLAMAFRTDYERRRDFLKKTLPKVTEIPPDEGVDGVIFFQLAKPPQNAIGSHLQFTFQNISTEKFSKIELAIWEPATPLASKGAPTLSF